MQLLARRALMSIKKQLPQVFFTLGNKPYFSKKGLFHGQKKENYFKITANLLPNPCFLFEEKHQKNNY